MSKIDYSPAAYNVLARFYRAKSILYVEGDDDVPFWSKIFSEFSDTKIEILPVGGAENIDEKIKLIMTGSVKILAARDSDFLRVCNESANHDQILYTYGYSIENTLLNRHAITEITSMACRGYDYESKKVDTWIDHIAHTLSNLIKKDIANYILKSGVAVLFDNCTRLMQNEKSCQPCEEKINIHQSKISKYFDEATLNLVDSHLEKHGISLEHHLRGHFLLSAVYKFIDQEVRTSKKGQVSYESIYVGAIQYLGTFLKSEDEHALHYKKQVSQAIASIQ